MYVLSVQYSCAVVSVFLFGGKANLVLLTLFYSTSLSPYTQTDGLTDRQRNKYTRFAWAGGTFFLVVLYVVSVFGSGGKKVLVQFWFKYVFTTKSTIQSWWCVSFLLAVENSFWCFAHT